MLSTPSLYSVDLKQEGAAPAKKYPEYQIPKPQHYIDEVGREQFGIRAKSAVASGSATKTYIPFSGGGGGNFT